jgi:transcriptional regulator with PAS, ATPase and Fis domain
VPSLVLESELFGHAQGSFATAYRDSPGLFQYAEGGTVLLEDVGALDERLQARLMRFLESGESQAIGRSEDPAAVNVRIMATTKRSLAAVMVFDGFNADLYYRLNAIHLTIPPLRERREDIEGLLLHFLDIFGQQYQVPMPRVSQAILDHFTAHDWPGNVLELRHVAEELIAHQREVIEPGLVAEITEHSLADATARVRHRHAERIGP